MQALPVGPGWEWGGQGLLTHEGWDCSADEAMQVLIKTDVSQNRSLFGVICS